MDTLNKPLVGLKEALVTGAIIDFLLLLLASLILDGGVIFCATFCSVAGHWIGIIVIILRRRLSLTRYDGDFIRFGTLGLAVIALSAAYCIGYVSCMFS